MGSAPDIHEILRAAPYAYDSFSLPWRKPRPIGQPGWDIQTALEPFKIREELTDHWPGTQIFYGKALVAYYRLCSETVELLDTVPDVFTLFGEGSPEDLTFYKAGAARFITISHEREAYILDT